jgi:hypothetical protein
MDIYCIVLSLSCGTCSQVRCEGGAEPANLAQGGRSRNLEGRLRTNNVRNRRHGKISTSDADYKHVRAAASLVDLGRPALAMWA